MRSSACMDLSEQWLKNPWLLWGVGPYIATISGFLLTAAVLELLLVAGAFDGSLLTYASSNHTPRRKLMAETRKRIPLRQQLQVSLTFILGIPTIIGCIGLVVLMQLLGTTASRWLPDTSLSALLQLLLLAVITDFGLYWGHRVQHESAFLWKFHAQHHSIDTPSPLSTFFIHPVDATLQGSLPLLLAAVSVRPAPAVWYLFLAARVAESVFNHSGVDSTLIDVITLKVLPLRASIAQHDAHHKYSNHRLNAKNYAESFWVWDAMFGTASPLTGHALSHQQVKA